MRASTRSSGLALVQSFLAVMVASTGLLAVAWITGYNGLGVLPALPHRLELSVQEVDAVPSEPVVVQGRAGVATAAAANAITGGVNGTLTNRDASHDPNGSAGPGSGTSEFYGNQAFLSFWALSTPQHVSWVAVRVAPLLGLTLIWWLLLAMVRNIRRGHGFTARTAKRIAGIGLLLALGMPLTQLLRWIVARWLVESSTATGIADPAPISLALWPVAVGMVLLVVALSWGEAARMRDDLQGLV